MLFQVILQIHFTLNPQRQGPYPRVCDLSQHHLSGLAKTARKSSSLDLVYLALDTEVSVHPLESSPALECGLDGPSDLE